MTYGYPRNCSLVAGGGGVFHEIFWQTIGNCGTQSQVLRGAPFGGGLMLDRLQCKPAETPGRKA